MTDSINLPLILLAALLATGSPGPATLAIAGASMNAGRRYGLSVAAGVSAGSLMWSSAAAFGLGAVMLANAWLFEVLRYGGSAYLLYLAYRSARSALRPGSIEAKTASYTSWRHAFASGVGLHLTNPKPVLFFGSLYAVGVPAHASPMELLTIILAVGLQSTLVFNGYALLFSSRLLANGYMRLRRWFEGAFAIAFAYAGIKILTARLN